MAIVRWAPFREIDTLRHEMDRLFDNLTHDTANNFANGLGNGFAPAVEIHETPESIELKAEIPGLEAKDLDIQVSTDAVSITGERKTETRTEEKGVVRSEFRYGQFSRVIPLPARIQNDKVQAEYKNGILMLNLPKVEAEKNKVVKVSLG